MKIKVLKTEGEVQVVDAHIDFIYNDKQYSATVSYDSNRDEEGIWIWDKEGNTVYEEQDYSGSGGFDKEAIDEIYSLARNVD